MNPEKNKNSEILPTNNVDIPQQTVVKTTVEQPIAASEQVQPEPRKFNFKNSCSKIPSRLILLFIN